MLKTSWVENLSGGRRVVEELRGQELRITAAFWFYFEEAERWRRKLIYAFANLHQRGEPVGITTEDIYLLGEESLIFKHVRDEVYGRGRNQGPVENFELDDAYVYTI